MSAVMFLIAGLIIVWVVFTGRASSVWDALTGATGGQGGQMESGAGGGGARGFE